MTITVYYAGMVLIEIPLEEYSQWRRSMCVGDPEVYNGAYAFAYQPPPTHVPGARIPIPNQPPGWFRLDGTPVLLSDVPQELQLLNLLIN